MRAQRYGETLKAAHAHSRSQTSVTEHRQLQPFCQAPRTAGVIRSAPVQTEGPEPNRAVSYGSWSIQRAQASLSGAGRRPLL